MEKWIKKIFVPCDPTDPRCCYYYDGKTYRARKSLLVKIANKLNR